MTLARPVGDIATFPAPGWTTAPLWSKVNTVLPDDLIFLTGLAPGAQDPQVALSLGDLEIPFGASGRIIVRVRMRWNETLTVAPDTVRIGIGEAANLGVTDPTLLSAFRLCWNVAPFAGQASLRGASCSILDAVGSCVQTARDNLGATASGPFRNLPCTSSSTPSTCPRWTLAMLSMHEPTLSKLAHACWRCCTGM